MRPRFIDWFQRVNFPSTSLPGLGFAGEYWHARPELYEGWQQLRDRLAALGRKKTKRELAYGLTSHLLEDVIVAAGGAERAITRLRASHTELLRVVAKHDYQAEKGVSFGFSDTASIDAWYAFADLLSWSRIVVERVDRRPEDPRKFCRQGLLHAIKPKRLRSRCDRLFDTLKNGPENLNGGRVLQSNIIAEARWFASFREEAGCATYAATPELRVKTRAMSRGVAPSATKPRNRRSSETVWSAASIFATRD